MGRSVAIATRVLHTLDEVEDLFVLLAGLGLAHQVNLVLEDNDGQAVAAQLHNLDGRKMLRRLWLRA